MGAVLAIVSIFGIGLAGLTGARLFGLSILRLLWAPPAYVVGGTLAGALGGLCEPWLTTRARAYMAGALISLPLGLMVRLILRGVGPWEGADTFALPTLALILGGPLGISFWTEAQKGRGHRGAAQRIVAADEGALPSSRRQRSRSRPRS
jgi:hypothetical protein